MKIGMDLDDTLSNTRSLMVKYHNELYNTNYKLEDIKNYDLWENWGGTLKTMVQELRKFNGTHYAQEIEPLEHARETLDKLKENNELYIITARSNEITKYTETWVETYFPNIFSKIYYTNEFSDDSSKITTKKNICDNLDLDIFIEDNLDYALKCSDQKRKVFLIDRPWNQTDELPPNVRRVHSWEEIGTDINNS